VTKTAGSIDQSDRGEKLPARQAYEPKLGMFHTGIQFQCLRVKSNTGHTARGLQLAKWKEITVTKRMSGKQPAAYLSYSPQSEGIARQ
jgi:hypothetical protein